MSSRRRNGQHLKFPLPIPFTNFHGISRSTELPRLNIAANFPAAHDRRKLTEMAAVMVCRVPRRGPPRNLAHAERFGYGFALSCSTALSHACDIDGCNQTSFSFAASA